MKNYLDISEQILKNFADLILTQKFVKTENGRIYKLRFELINLAVVDIFYSSESGKYSFHYQLEDETYRHDNAPHFNHIETYPKHCHHNDKIEESFLSDDILKASVEFFQIIKEKFIK